MLKIEGESLKYFFNGETLYIPNTPKVEATTAFDYEGGNNKYILMLFNHSGKNAVPQAQKPFLEKILGATKLSFDDVAMCNWQQMGTPTFDGLKGYFAPSSLFLWGVNPAQLGIQAALYQPVIHNKVMVVCVDTIETIENDKNLKAKLWGILQSHFLK